VRSHLKRFRKNLNIPVLQTMQSGNWFHPFSHDPVFGSKSYPRNDQGTHTSRKSGDHLEVEWVGEKRYRVDLDTCLCAFCCSTGIFSTMIMVWEQAGCLENPLYQRYTGFLPMNRFFMTLLMAIPLSSTSTLVASVFDIRLKTDYGQYMLRVAEEK